jgi:hypothetical protein
MTIQASPSRSLSLVAALLLGACATDGVIGVNETTLQGTFTVNAATAWQYVDLSDSSLVAPLPSANLSAVWDIAFFGTNVTLNGGDAGPGGVTAACICQNATATGEQVLAMTAENQLAAFEAVTSVPAGLEFQSDALTPAITGWHTGTGAAVTADPSKSWLVRTADSAAYAVVRVIGISGASASNAGIVTLEWKLQANATAPLGAPQTLAVDLTTPGAKRVDLRSGSLTSDAAAWDLQLSGFVIRVNGGISGPGKGGAATTTVPFADATTAVTAANAYRIDVYAGVFGSQRYYRYNIAGDHRISPTFDVYLVRRGADTYKLQVIGYYGPTGDSRQISFRWARLD